MDDPRSHGDNRAISPVIGTILMIAITVMAMTMVGAVVLQGPIYGSTTQIEVVHDQTHEGDMTNITVGVTSGEGELDFVADGERPCDWDAPQEVERGTILSISCDSSDIPESGSISLVQVGGQSTVIDQLDIEKAVSKFVTDLSTNSPTLEKDTLEVVGEVRNIGNAESTQDITLEVGPESKTRTVNLDDSEMGTVELEWDTNTGDAGDYTAQIASDDDSTSSIVTVNEEGAPIFEVKDIEYDKEVFEGDTATFDVVIENIGEESGTQDIELEITNEENVHEVVDVREDLELGGGESRTVTLSWDTEDRENKRSYPATVRTRDDHDPKPVVHIAEMPSLKFVDLTAEVTDEVSKKNHGSAPSKVEFNYELNDAYADEEVKFEVKVGENTKSISKTSVEGTVTVNMNTKANQHSYPAQITVTAGGEECTAMIKKNDGAIDVC